MYLLISLLPFLVIFLLQLLPSYSIRIINLVSLLFSGFFSFIVSFYLIKTFLNDSFCYYQNTFLEDFISMSFICLSSFLIFFCILYNISTFVNGVKYFNSLLFFLLGLLVQVFLTDNLFLFFIFFESVLLPMFIIIGVWGSRQRKIHALFYLFFYTIFGSIFMLAGLLYIYIFQNSFEYNFLVSYSFKFYEEILLFFFFFIGFAVKVPLWPFHIWLPEAHVESPTSGSVILAGILLKLGTYGMLRFLLPIFPNGSFFLAPFVLLLCTLGILYSSFIILRQIDFKKIIAYSSIIHMSYAIVGLFSFNIIGVSGSVLVMFSHGFISGALFFLIGLLYERYHTRIIFYYGGLFLLMPIFSVFFLFFSLANMSLPGLFSFVGEFLILVGSFIFNPFVSIYLTIMTFFSVVYSVWLFNRLVFGNFSNFIFKFCDITLKELYILANLSFFVLFFGLYTKSLLNLLEFSLLCYFN